MIYQDVTGEIIGCAMEVHRQLGSGFQEYIYQRALEIEFQNRKVKAQREFEIKIHYKGEYIGLRRVDFLVHDAITVELKAVSELQDNHIAQAVNYIEASSYPIGLLINFGSKSLQFKRLYNKKSPHNQFQSNES